MGKQWKQWQTIFLGSKISTDGDCSHEIKRHLILGRKVMTNLGSIFKSNNSSPLSLLYGRTLTSILDYWKKHSLTGGTFIDKVMSLLFNMLSRLVIAFLPRIKCLLISWLQSPSAVSLEHKKQVCHYFQCFPTYCHEVMGPDAMILVFWMLSFKPVFSLSSFTFIKRLSSSLLSGIRVVPSTYLRLLSHWYFSWHSWFELVLYPAQHGVLCI